MENKSSLLEKLRNETQEAHVRLEENSFSQKLIAETISQSEYRRMLEKFYGYFGPMERNIKKVKEIASMPDCFQDRDRAQLLIRDLCALGLTEADVSRLPLASTLPDCQNLAQALGCAYVLQGSTLGGQVIVAHIKRNTQLNTTQAFTFFAGFGRETGPRWRQFLSALTLFGQNHSNQHNEVVSAACETFSGLEQWLKEP